MKRTLYGSEHDAFRQSARDFLAKEVVPHFPRWEEAGLVPREIFHKLGDLGVLGIQIPEEHGGGGADTFLYSAVWAEETARAYVNLGGLSVHTNVVLPYFLSLADVQQRQRWFPGLACGDLMSAIAMTEPGTGSDLAGMATTAVRDGEDWILNGAKTFITGGIHADLVIVVARTSTPENRRDGLTLLVVERAMDGFTRGRNLDKIGLKTQDTAELFFQDVRVPQANVLGEEGRAFRYLTGNLPQERLGIAVAAQAAAEAALTTTTAYVKDRQVFGKPVAAFQNTKFELAACATDVAAGRALVDKALVEHEDKELSAADAAMVKLFCTEMQSRVIDRCLQLHGGYGYMREYPIARLYADARVTRIYGGTSEVLKTIIAKSIDL
ncbi:acyl-CoA dehydrogenase family protein [Pseudonocardia kunmingensis]|uniref:Acyl-[acyl-carrier-protein] dehydrogenase MbtN n=1 Tax=Pseudonocardia kunmingensis TaxID=630975 RepID=A0A543DPW7_9PSEU|nr:acyl-CoA dehydrogenase family protein [Pseudonocardia kunmingensis]TQM11370.1 long-chain-acyl-CoA dehydrogenase [Pseudonocardia kunmingensis]